jgi:hypothetical protein
MGLRVKDLVGGKWAGLELAPELDEREGARVQGKLATLYDPSSHIHLALRRNGQKTN